jgi:hypothetical protein
MMILTTLEGRVASQRWETLKQAYHEGIQQLPSEIYETYLVQDEEDSDIWRILTFWHRRQALQDYRATVDTPVGILMFRAAGVEPTLSIYEVSDHAHRD